MKLELETVRGTIPLPASCQMKRRRPVDKSLPFIYNEIASLIKTR